MKLEIVFSLLLILLFQGVQGLALRNDHEQRIPGLAYKSYPEYQRGCKNNYCWSMCDGAGRWCYTSNWAGTSTNIGCSGNDSSKCPVFYETGYKDNCAGTCWYF
jgi:hypothetical protein